MTANQRLALLSHDAALLTNPLAGEERNKLRGQILKLSQDNLSLVEQLATRCLKIVDRLNTRATAVNLALRRELKIPIDENWYREMQAQTLKLNEKRSAPLLEAMQKNLGHIRETRPYPAPRSYSQIL